MCNSFLQSEGNPSVDRAVTDESVRRLLERISELEDENASLRKLEETIRANNHFFEALLCSKSRGDLAAKLCFDCSAIGSFRRGIDGKGCP